MLEKINPLLAIRGSISAWPADLKGRERDRKLNAVTSQWFSSEIPTKTLDIPGSGELPGWWIHWYTGRVTVLIPQRTMEALHCGPCQTSGPSDCSWFISSIKIKKKNKNKKTTKYSTFLSHSVNQTGNTWIYCQLGKSAGDLGTPELEAGIWSGGSHVGGCALPLWCVH